MRNWAIFFLIVHPNKASSIDQPTHKRVSEVLNNSRDKISFSETPNAIESQDKTMGEQKISVELRRGIGFRSTVVKIP